MSTSDEVSLRDIYLLLRRNSLLIVGVALSAALIAFFVARLQTPMYEAESVALVTPPPISIRASGQLGFNPSTHVSFEAYESLAKSRAVLEQTVASLPEVKLNYTQLRGQVKKLVGPQRPDQSSSLLVAHIVQHSEPELAARLADTWALTTLRTIEASLLDNLEPISLTTAREVEGLRIQLETAEAALETFQSQNQLASLQLRLERLSSLIADAETQVLTTTELRLSPDPSRQTSGPGQVVAGQSYNSVQIINLEQEIAASQAMLASLQGPAQSDPELRRESQRLAAQLEALLERQRVLGRQLGDYLASYASLQQQLATLERRERELQRNLSNAELAYQSVVTLQPTIDYLTQLTPNNTQLLNIASIPDRAINTSAALIAALTAVIMTVIMTIAIFLRAAVTPVAAKNV